MTHEHDQAEVERVARGLTKAQRPHVLNGCISGDFAMQTVRALIGKGIMYLRICSPDGHSGFVEPTPLGLAVRAHLMREQQGGQG